MIIILDINVDTRPLKKSQVAANYAVKMFKNSAFRHVKKLEFKGQTYVMVSDFSKLYIVKIEFTKKPKGKKELTTEEIENIEDIFNNETRVIFDRAMIAYVEFNDKEEPISFDWIKTE